MKTEKLYYNDGYLKSFDAEVIACEKENEKIYVVLNKTAFFPEGGGQKADTGFIGSVKVTDVQESDGIIKHFVNEPIPFGEHHCKIDWDVRFRRMQNHSGEHIVSGIVNSAYGFDNVGFHLEDSYSIVDFSGELSDDELDSVEKLANEAVCKNMDIKILYPDADELDSIKYRSKLELTEDVRLVRIGDVDLCACCAPHVNKTGAIGAIKILSSMRHRGGVRITMTCGLSATDDYRMKHSSVCKISELLSAKQTKVVESVERLKNENDDLKRELYTFKQSIALNDRENLYFVNDISYYISSFYDADMMRTLANYGMEKSKLSVILSGDDESGYSYIAGSNTADMKAFAKSINTALSGRGGGRDTMIQGKVSASKANILRFLNSLNGENI